MCKQGPAGIDHIDELSAKACFYVHFSMDTYV